jgi:hypothetical protein
MAELAALIMAASATLRKMLRIIFKFLHCLGVTPERDDFSSNRHPALSFCLSMILSENRCTLSRIMLQRSQQLVSSIAQGHHDRYGFGFGAV